MSSAINGDEIRMAEAIEAIRAAHVEHPTAKLVHVTHWGLRVSFVLAVPDTHFLHPFLPDYQLHTIPANGLGLAMLADLGEPDDETRH